MSAMPRPVRPLERVAEIELAVLVVGAARDRVHVDLVEVVLTRPLDGDARLHRVPALHPRERVGPQVDRPLRRRRVRAAVDRRERVDVDRRDLVLDLLARVDVRVVHPRAAPLVEPRLGEDVDEHLVFRVRVAGLVDQVVRDRPRPVRVHRPVRTVPVGAREREGPAVGVDRRVVLLRVAERERVIGAQAVVEPEVVLPLVHRVVAVLDEVVRPGLEPGRRQRVQLHQRDAVRRQAVRRDDVARERQAGERVADDLRACCRTGSCPAAG